MKLTVNLKLQPNTDQANLLRQTMGRANAAANHAGEVAWATHTFQQFRLQKLVYGALKADFALCAQMAVRVVAKVAGAYKLEHRTQRVFQPLGAIAYDDRILRFKPGDQVSIWALGGRQVISFICGDYQRRFLPYRRGEVDLVYHGGNFYLNIVCEVEEPPLTEPKDFLGVDLGIVNIATDSDGNVYSGAKVETNPPRLRPSPT